jgi:predicted ATPase|tara:strand:+ start:87 stop:878 length:792 start_codon:yes stop_codon:yes gene_type:complete
VSYISKVSIDCPREQPFPFDISAVKYAKGLDFSNPITFIIGDNGTGKSTLLETIAFRLQLPNMDGSSYSKRGFEAARILMEYLSIEWAIDRPRGFFLRAEDFGNLLNGIQNEDNRLSTFFEDIKGDVPDHVLRSMRDNSNYQIHNMYKNYGQDLQGFSHGEAYFKIMNDKINQRGIYLLDEPEAALSPSKQLSLLYFIKEHLRHNISQFIVATHSPMLMAYPGATIYQISDDGMKKVDFEDTDHYSITRSFLNNPDAYLRHLE